MDAKKQKFKVEEREFAQDRARRTYEALVDAARDLFRERGYDATQTPDIAAKAGVSVGSFYRYFEDKREVFMEIYRAALSEAYNEVMDQLTPERFAGNSSHEAISGCVDILVDHVVKEPAMQRVWAEMAMRDEQVADLRRTFEGEARKRIAAFIDIMCSKERIPDPEASAFLIHKLAVEVAISLSGVYGEPPITAERAKVALSKLIHQALFDDD